MTHATPIDILAKAERPPRVVFDAEMLWRLADARLKSGRSSLTVGSEEEASYLRTRAENEGYMLTPITHEPSDFTFRYGILNGPPEQPTTCILRIVWSPHTK